MKHDMIEGVKRHNTSVITQAKDIMTKASKRKTSLSLFLLRAPIQYPMSGYAPKAKPTRTIIIIILTFNAIPMLAIAFDP